MINVFERRKILLKRWFINEIIMKKYLCLILSVLLTASFTACDIENSATPDGSPSPPTSVTPNGSQLPSTSVTPTIKPTTTPDKTTEVDGVFSVSQKKYTFKGNNVMLLNVENTSDTAYSIEITASYKNTGGNNIKSEVISFEGFAPNWSNYFVLNPQISFDEFEFELKATPYSGPVLADKVHLDTEHPLCISVLLQDEIGFILDKKHITVATEKDIKKGTIIYELTSYVTSPTPITFWSTAVAFNSKGEIVAIAPDRMHYKIDNDKEQFSRKGLASLDIDTSDIEMLKGVTSIGCLLSIDYDE